MTAITKILSQFKIVRQKHKQFFQSRFKDLEDGNESSKQVDGLLSRSSLCEPNPVD